MGRTGHVPLKSTEAEGMVSKAMIDFMRTVSRALRGVLPDSLDRIPSDEDDERDRDEIATAIVQQHAEGSVLLGAGKFETGRDLLEDDDPHDTHSLPAAS